MSIKMKSVEVSTKALKAEWSVEMVTDLSHHYGIDDNFLEGILRSEIRRNKIKKIFKK
jgi:hypothetical protein